MIEASLIAPQSISHVIPTTLLISVNMQIIVTAIRKAANGMMTMCRTRPYNCYSFVIIFNDMRNTLVLVIT